MCFQTGVHCDFTKITLCDDGDYGGDRNEDDHNSRLSASDLMAWQAFYKTLAGHRWLACSRNLNTPCDCKDRVECQVGQSNAHCRHPHAWEQRSRAIAHQASSHHESTSGLDLSTSSSIGEASVANKIYLKPCLALPRCRSEMVCAIAGVNTSTVQYCDQEGAHATTLLQQDLLAWSKFYQETGGWVGGIAPTMNLLHVIVVSRPVTLPPINT
ncbi:hypothetical protein BASA81_018102 [Batrachochytrium salamandrivorans]|nr:hypothetical protein BASA81_018102 [Batrachochytrium salamandrivorans]